jgi:hypothetical protein
MVTPQTALIFQNALKCQFLLALSIASSTMATGLTVLTKDTAAVTCTSPFRLQMVADLAPHAKWSATIALLLLLVLKNVGLKTVMILFLLNHKVRGSEFNKVFTIKIKTFRH